MFMFIGYIVGWYYEEGIISGQEEKNTKTYVG